MSNKVRWEFMKTGLILALIIILISEVLRAFRKNRRVISEVEELKDRVKNLEDKIKER